ncbi:MAG: ABC transporter permease [Actinobacteria bacterium]|nr:ABC transporter permease [Actinomycetota bacterium]
MALRELRRRPGRFVVATVILGVIAVLLMFLGGLLDGLLASSTGAYRAQQADVVVYSANARESLVRSRIETADRTAIEQVPGVEAVGGLGSVQLGARPQRDPQTRDLVATVLLGYELAPAGLPDQPPARGTVIADSSAQADGVDEGDVLLLGPMRTPVEVVGFVDDTRYAGQASLWGSLETWQDVIAANRPDRAFTGGAVQALVVRAGDVDPGELADAIDAATDGRTASLTLDDAINALPGVEQQRSTFNQIIRVTALVALVVVALFFALITVERTALYGILKAVGASSSTLFGGVVVQALVVTLTASAAGAVGALTLDALVPPGSIPFEVTSSRLASSVVLMIVAAVVGSAFSLRRVLRIDPASAIGTAS